MLICDAIRRYAADRGNDRRAGDKSYGNTTCIPRLRGGRTRHHWLTAPPAKVMNVDLTDEEAAALARLLRGTIDADRYPLSPRVKTWQAIPEKIEPLSVRAPLSRISMRHRARMLGARR
jgi:hypothetical protein